MSSPSAISLQRQFVPTEGLAMTWESVAGAMRYCCIVGMPGVPMPAFDQVMRGQSQAFALLGIPVRFTGAALLGTPVTEERQITVLAYMSDGSTPPAPGLRFFPARSAPRDRQYHPLTQPALVVPPGLATAAAMPSATASPAAVSAAPSFADDPWAALDQAAGAAPPSAPPPVVTPPAFQAPAPAGPPVALPGAGGASFPLQPQHVQAGGIAVTWTRMPDAMRYALVVGVVGAPVVALEEIMRGGSRHFAILGIPARFSGATLIGAADQGTRLFCLIAWRQDGSMTAITDARWSPAYTAPRDREYHPLTLPTLAPAPAVPVAPPVPATVWPTPATPFTPTAWPAAAASGQPAMQATQAAAAPVDPWDLLVPEEPVKAPPPPPPVTPPLVAAAAPVEPAAPPIAPAPIPMAPPDPWDLLRQTDVADESDTWPEAEPAVATPSWTPPVEEPPIVWEPKRVVSPTEPPIVWEPQPAEPVAVEESWQPTPPVEDVWQPSIAAPIEARAPELMTPMQAREVEAPEAEPAWEPAAAAPEPAWAPIAVQPETAGEPEPPVTLWDEDAAPVAATAAAEEAPAPPEAADGAYEAGILPERSTLAALEERAPDVSEPTVAPVESAASAPEPFDDSDTPATVAPEEASADLATLPEPDAQPSPPTLPTSTAETLFEETPPDSTRETEAAAADAAMVAPAEPEPEMLAPALPEPEPEAAPWPEIPAPAAIAEVEIPTARVDLSIIDQPPTDHLDAGEAGQAEADQMEANGSARAEEAAPPADLIGAAQVESLAVPTADAAPIAAADAAITVPEPAPSEAPEPSLPSPEPAVASLEPADASLEQPAEVVAAAPQDTAGVSFSAEPVPAAEPALELADIAADVDAGRATAGAEAALDPEPEPVPSLGTEDAPEARAGDADDQAPVASPAGIGVDAAPEADAPFRHMEQALDDSLLAPAIVDTIDAPSLVPDSAPAQENGADDAVSFAPDFVPEVSAAPISEELGASRAEAPATSVADDGDRVVARDDRAAPPQEDQPAPEQQSAPGEQPVPVEETGMAGAWAPPSLEATSQSVLSVEAAPTAREEQAEESSFSEVLIDDQAGVVVSQSLDEIAPAARGTPSAEDAELDDAWSRPAAVATPQSAEEPDLAVEEHRPAEELNLPPLPTAESSKAAPAEPVEEAESTAPWMPPAEPEIGAEGTPRQADASVPPGALTSPVAPEPTIGEMDAPSASVTEAASAAVPAPSSPEAPIESSEPAWVTASTASMESGKTDLAMAPPEPEEQGDPSWTAEPAAPAENVESDWIVPSVTVETSESTWSSAPSTPVESDESSWLIAPGPESGSIEPAWSPPPAPTEERGDLETAAPAQEEPAAVPAQEQWASSFVAPAPGPARTAPESAPAIPRPAVLDTSPLSADLAALLDESELYLQPPWLDYDEANRLIEQAALAAPNHVRVYEARFRLHDLRSGMSVVDVEGLVEDARRQLAAGDHWGAVDLFEQALAARPDHTGAAAGLARARLMARWSAQLSGAGSDALRLEALGDEYMGAAPDLAAQAFAASFTARPTSRALRGRLTALARAGTLADLGLAAREGVAGLRAVGAVSATPEQEAALAALSGAGTLPMAEEAIGRLCDLLDTESSR